jgi:hypothetical protein
MSHAKKLNFTPVEADGDNFPELLDLLSMLLAHDDRDIRKGEKGEPLSAPTTVYRIEMPDGSGPFNWASCPSESLRRAIYDTLTRPLPGWPGEMLRTNEAMHHEQMGVTETAFKEAYGHAAYACRDLASLATWFPRPSREYIATFGGKVVAYHLPEGAPILPLYDSEGELVFSRPTAIKVEHHDIMEGLSAC